MKALLLCAGKGTRLRPLTYSVPKPMVPLVDKPVIQHIIEHLRSHNVTDIAVNLSYKPEVIQHYLRDGANFGVNICYSYEGVMNEGVFEGTALGSAGGLKKIQEETGFFDSTFVVLCGDAAINLDITALVEQHKKRGALASIVLKDVNIAQVEKYGIVELDRDGLIKQFQEKPSSEDAVSTLANTGIYIFEPEVIDHIPVNTVYDLGGDLFPDLAKKGAAFYGAKAEFDWLDVGNLNDLRGASQKILQNDIENLKLSGTEIADGVHVGSNVSIDLNKVYIKGPVYIGSGSKIANNSKIIGPCVIGQNCVIEEHSIVHRSLLGDHSRLRRNTLISKAISFGGYIINERDQSELIRPGAGLTDVRMSQSQSGGVEHAIADLNLLDRVLTDDTFMNHTHEKIAS